MADYNIKFEYKGMGKQASAARQKVLQAQKRVEKRQGSTTGGKDLSGSLKALNTSINKLIASNNKLAGAIGGKGVSGGGGSGGPRSGFGASAGFGRAGASLPIVGAAIAIAGFAIQKISQIGNAYISLVSQQKTSAGVGGFREGRQGMYLQSEVGQGMKAYGMQSGKFANDVKPGKTALDYGGVFGMSAPEVMGQAGTFKRAGVDYGKTVGYGAGAGLETQLPTLMTGIAGLLEEAVRDGVNSSDMSKDIGVEITSLATSFGQTNVASAMNMVKSLGSVLKTKLGRGKYGDYESNLLSMAHKERLVERFTGEGKEKYIQSLVDQKRISPERAKQYRGLKKGSTISDIRNIGPSSMNSILREMAFEPGAKERAPRDIVRMGMRMHGKSSEARDIFSGIYAKQGGSMNPMQLRAAWEAELKGTPGGMTKDVISKQGLKGLKGRHKTLLGSGVGLGTQKEGLQQKMLMDFGGNFADLTLTMQTSMANLASTMMGGGGVNAALREMASMAKKASKILNGISKKSIGNTIKDAMRDVSETGSYMLKAFD